MKKTVIWSWVSMAVIMVGLPVAYLFAPSDAGMTLLGMSFLAINPVYSAVLGAGIGRQFRALWYIPLVNALIYLITVCCIFGFQSAFLLYAGFYLALGYLGAGVRNLIPKA